LPLHRISNYISVQLGFAVQHKRGDRAFD